MSPERKRIQCDRLRYITLGAKRAGEPCAGNLHARFDEAGAGNVAIGAGLRPTAKVVDKPPDPNVRAPVLDPTEILTFRRLVRTIGLHDKVDLR